MASTKYVPAWACWGAYITAVAAMAIVSLHSPLFPASTFWNGFAAHSLATCMLWVWSVAYSNTSIYDPAWCYFPIAMGVCWMAGAAGVGAGVGAGAGAGPPPSMPPSTRGIVALALLCLWCARYAVIDWPWEGWTKGLRAEDWRYVSIAKRTGSGTALYWAVSLVSLHLTPTWLVFASMSPLERVWTGAAAAAASPLGVWDAAGIVICVSGVMIQRSADGTLFEFRAKAYGTREGKGGGEREKERVCVRERGRERGGGREDDDELLTPLG